MTPPTKPESERCGVCCRAHRRDLVYVCPCSCHVPAAKAEPAQPAAVGGSFIIRALAALVHSTYREAPLSEMDGDATKELACEARREYDRLRARCAELEAQIPAAAVAALQSACDTVDFVTFGIQGARACERIEQYSAQIESRAIEWRDGAWRAKEGG